MGYRKQKRNEQTKQKPTHRYKQRIGGYKRRYGMVGDKMVNGVRCLVAGGNETFGAEHIVIYRDMEL